MFKFINSNNKSLAERTVQYSFGPITIELQGKRDLLDNLSFDLDEGLTHNRPNVDLRIKEASKTNLQTSPQAEACKGKFKVNEGGFYSGFLSGVEYHLIDRKKSIKSKFKLTKIGPLKKVERNLSSFQQFKFNSSYDALYANVCSYSYFYMLLALTLTRENATFIHAGAFSSKNRAAVICGTGGCGKTSLVMELCKNRGYDFMSEDFGIIDSDGFSHYSSKSISLYNSDFQAFGEDPANYLSFIDSLKWKLSSKVLRQNPRIKLRPTDYFKCDRERRMLSHAFYLRRKSVSDVAVNEVFDVWEFIDLVHNANMRELTELTSISRLLKSVSYDLSIMSNYEHKSREILYSAFNNTRRFIIDVPIGITPSALADHLSRLFEGQF